MVLKSYGEQRLGELALDGVEPGFLLRGLNSVDAAHSESKETVGVDVTGELSRNGRCSLNRLGGRCNSTDSDLVGVDLSRCSRAVSVRDLPGVSALDLCGVHLVVVMAR